MKQRLLIALAAALVLAALNFSIAGKERIKRDGEVVYLELAPVDPRSLMQGDYMTLRFKLATDIEARIETAKSERREGMIQLVPVEVDANRVATLATPEKAGALKIRYRFRNGQVWLGTNAFFFEEGSARQFAGARYGEFRLDKQTGEAVLVGLRSPTFEKL
jgi:uncharacterized membrane-anchored protein